MGKPNFTYTLYRRCTGKERGSRFTDNGTGKDIKNETFQKLQRTLNRLGRVVKR
jgi:hypothetical protein